MAQFFNGLEETPYTGWTLSGMTSCAHRLFLSGGGLAVECDNKTSWTAVSGTPSTAQYGRLAFTGVGQDKFVFTPGNSSDFDIRVDTDQLNAAAQAQIQFNFVNTNYCYVLFQTNTSSVTFKHTGGSVDWSNGVWPNIYQSTFRMRYSSGVFSVWVLDPRTNAWTQVGTNVTLANGTVANIQMGNTSTGTWYFDSIRNVLPTVTSGTATSPVMDTVDGFRGVGWFADSGTGITGTVAVTVRTGPTSSPDGSWTSYTSATAWAAVTPSAANRYVQVQVAITGGSTSAGSPEVGPILINGSCDATSTALLFKRSAASMIFHTDASFQLGYSGASNSSFSYWGRSAAGFGRWIAQQGASLTWHGTTVDLATQSVGGWNATITHFAGGNQLQIETCYYLLSGIYEGRSVLLPTVQSSPYITSGQKTTWTTDINAQIQASSSGNFAAQSLHNPILMTAIWNWEKAHFWANTPVSGQWSKTGTTPYADSDVATAYSSLISAELGDGALVDSATHIGDSYSLVVGSPIARTLLAEPTYTNASGLTPILQSLVRYSGDLAGNDGYMLRPGRSQHGSAVFDHSESLVMEMEQLASGVPIVREIVGRVVWNSLRTQWLYGYDYFLPQQNRLSPITSLTTDTGASAELISAMNAGILGLFATSSTLFSVAPLGPPSAVESAIAHPAWGVATAIGADSTYPRLSSNAIMSDLGTYGPRYDASRVLAERFAQNTGLASTNIMDPHSIGMFWHDSSLSSGNQCSLSTSSAGSAYTTGLGAATYRSGTPQQFSATVAGTNVTGVSYAHTVWLRGRHAVQIAKLSMGSPDGRTISNYGFASPPVPVDNGATLTNTATDSSTYYYGEQPTALQSDKVLSIFGQGLTANQQGAGIARINTDFVTAASQGNHDWYGGKGVDLFQTSGVTLASPLYAAADFAMGFGSLTAATEAARIGSWANPATDVFTFTYDPSGTPELVVLTTAGQTWSGFAVGSYAITSGSSAGRGFSGKSAAADWFGGSDLTLIKYSGNNLAALATAGNIACQKVSASVTRVWTSGSNTTIYASALPAGASWFVFAYNWDGTTTNITGSCTITSSTSVLIPSATVSTYTYGGLAQFDMYQLPVGTMAATLAAATFAGLAGVAAMGSMAAILAADAFAGAGSFLVAATMAKTLSADTFAGAGVGGCVASMGVTLLPDTFAGAATLSLTASMAVTLAPDVMAGFGLSGAGASMAATLTPDTFTGGAAVQVSALMAVTLVADTFAGAASGGGIAISIISYADPRQGYILFTDNDPAGVDARQGTVLQ